MLDIRLLAFGQAGAALLWLLLRSLFLQVLLSCDFSLISAYERGQRRLCLAIIECFGVSTTYGSWVVRFVGMRTDAWMETARTITGLHNTTLLSGDQNRYKRPLPS